MLIIYVAARRSLALPEEAIARDQKTASVKNTPALRTTSRHMPASAKDARENASQRHYIFSANAFVKI